MKKSLKSQLVAAISMMLIATVALTSATYAWFTSVANPEVKSINLTVKAEDTIKLSAYVTKPDINLDADWKSSISQEDIYKDGSTTAWGKQAGAFPTDLVNASSVFTTANNKFYKASFSSAGALEGYNEITQPNNFAKFTLWVKSTNKGYLYINKSSVVTAVSGIAPAMNVRDTVRVGFVPVDYDADGEGSNPAGTGEDWDNAVIWEPNSTDHLDDAYAGVGDDKTTKYETKAIKGTADTEANKEVQLTYDFKDGDTNVLAADKHYTTVKTDTTQDQIALFNVAADTIVHFNVYIWVEGADVDTLNAVAKNGFQTKLIFGQEKNIYISK